MSIIGNKSSIPSENSTKLENIVLRKGAITIPADIRIVHTESAIENQPRHSRKRKGSVFDETAIGKKSVTELNSMVDQNHKHMEFLSECGQLSKNHESVLLEDINNLSSIIQQKQSMESCNGVFENIIH